MGQEDGEICTGQALLQPISFRSDRLLGIVTRVASARDGVSAVLCQPIEAVTRYGLIRCESAMVSAGSGVANLLNYLSKPRSKK